VHSPVVSRARPLCVHVIPSTEQAGAQTRARELIESLARQHDYELEIVYFAPGRGHFRFQQLDIPLLHLHKRFRFMVDFPRLSWLLRRRYAGREPDILHTWMLHGNVAGLLAARSWRDTSVVITQCQGIGEEVYFRGQLRFQGFLIGRADHAISNSSVGAETLQRLGMAASDVSVVRNGISEERVSVGRDRASVRDELRVPATAPLAVAVTRADDAQAFRYKNLPGLLDAIGTARRSSPNLHLALVGPTADELASFGVELPAWAVTTGFVTRPADYMAAGDVAVIASRAEGMSNAGCEALMLGLPVASTAVGDHVPLVEEGGGRSVPPNDSDALATAVNDLLRDPPDREAIRASARRHLSLEGMTQSTVEIYERLLTEGQAGEMRRGYVRKESRSRPHVRA
jgi:glycosyltransferase involved in cell wall biosynthesis